MNFFLPDWEDRLDPKYNFRTDAFSREKTAAYSMDVYAHQIFKKAPYDGILISLAIFKDKLNLTSNDNGETQVRQYSSIRDYLRITKKSKLKVLGDCGAFSYINENLPPDDYETKKVSKIYDTLKFDYGVSVDHMIPDFIVTKTKKSKVRKKMLTGAKKEERRQLSIKNAHKFIKYHGKKKFSFVPIGAVQGYSPETYADSAARTIDMGYSYIGLGTLVPKSDEGIIEILRAVRKVIGKRKIKLHLFGIVRPKKLAEFKSLGVTSLDSASFLRKAWLRAGQNYLTKNDGWYAAIRVPYSSNSILLKNAAQDGISEAEVREMEERALNALRDYANGHVKDLDKVLHSVLRYDMLLLREHDGNHHYDKYRKTLLARPWEKCDCEICRKIGIDVMIFRGANRNKRRGFHNTKIFYDQLKKGG